ncbi:MAG: hypothetical protein ACREVL_12160 [Solimonas sp.]
MITKPALRALALAAALPLTLQPGAARADTWQKGSMYFEIRGVTVQVNYKCPSATSADLIVGALGGGGAPAYWIRTADNKSLPLPVLPNDTPRMPQGVPAGSARFTVPAPCTETGVMGSGSLFQIYADPQFTRRVLAFP